jgi:hypothetical protein
VCWLVACDSPRYLAGHRPAVSRSRGFLLALASSGLLLSHSRWLAPTLSGSHRAESCWRSLRSQFPWLASRGRCYPPGLSAVQPGQYVRLAAPYPAPFWRQRLSLWRGVPLTVAGHPFACAAHRCWLDGRPRSRLPGSAVYPRSRPWRTSRESGGEAGPLAPRGRDLHPHGELSYNALSVAIFPRTEVLFRSTGRTDAGGE